MNSTIETKKDKEYYESRLECVKTMFRKGNRGSLVYGKDRIENLISEYEKLPDHNKILAGTVKNFILNFIEE